MVRSWDDSPERSPATPRWARALTWLTLAVATVSCRPRTERLAGDYHSTWGGCLVTVRGRDAVVRYPHGVMSCQVATPEGSPVSLTCSWQSGEERGRARFQVATDGRWEGHWGHGEREDDGGAWVLTR